MIQFGTVLSPAAQTFSARRLKIEGTPKDLFERILSRYENAFLLESAKGKSRLAEYSFIGFEPARTVIAKDGVLEIKDRGESSADREKVADPFEELKRIVPPNSVTGLFRFIGGAVGFVGYDSVRYFERIPSLARDDMALPDFQFGIYGDGVVYDHARQEFYYYTLGEDRAEEVLAASEARAEEEPTTQTEPRSTILRNDFENKVEAVKEHILNGDIFQAVISRRCDFEAGGDLTGFYRALSEINPSPYMYFLKFGERRIVGSSPEMLVRIEDGRIESYPIAGTRPRVEDEVENSKLATELLNDPKELAEHVMLVDLSRNDVGRVSEYGSVEVPEFLGVERYSHVQHIVSHVVGRLRKGEDSYSALRAVFPAGTVSGAPKVRAMEIIEAMEPFRRGPYAGAVGYLSFNGNSDFAITIRTLVSEGKRCSVQAGAGIVADSSPAAEWAETEAKAEGLFKAMGLAEERKD